MNKLESMAARAAMLKMKSAINSIRDQSDNVSDLVMYADSEGKCEVSIEELQAIAVLIQLSLENAYKNLKDAEPWLEGLVQQGDFS